MMGSFDIHILDPELYDMVQCISIVFSVSTAAALFYGTRSFREVLGRYAPVTAAAVLTLNTIDIHWTISRSSDPEYVLFKNI